MLNLTIYFLNFYNKYFEKIVENKNKNIILFYYLNLFLEEFILENIEYNIGILDTAVMEFFFYSINKFNYVKAFLNGKFFKNFVVKIKIIEKKIFLLEKREKSKYYYVKNNMWPFFLSFVISLILLKIVFFLHGHSFFASSFISVLLFFFLIVGFYGWFKNLSNESLYENEQTLPEKKNLVQGFLLFILVEFMTFAGCFWVLFHSGLAPSIWIGALWPGEGIVCILVSEDVTLYTNFNKTIHFFSGEPCTVNYNSWGLENFEEFNINLNYYPDKFRVHINLFDKGQLINPYKVPLMNTFILLTSAATITLSHKSLKLEKYFLSIIFLFLTIIFGIIFVKIQYLEYKNSMISSHDGIYGSSFFAITGLHGLHVILGILFLFVCLINLIFKKYSSNSHRSFEFAIWYWHFVDVIWIFVYFLLYLWPASFFFKQEIFVWTISENYFCVNMSIDTYREIVYLNYLQEIRNKNSNLNWVADNLQNYNMNLIRRHIDHYHFFLEMSKEYILINVMLNNYFDKTKYESVLSFSLLVIYTIWTEKDLWLFVFISVIVFFSTNGFDFIPLSKKIYNFFYTLFWLRKNDKIIFIIENLENLEVFITTRYIEFKNDYFNTRWILEFPAFLYSCLIPTEEDVLGWKNFWITAYKNFIKNSISRAKYINKRKWDFLYELDRRAERYENDKDTFWGCLIDRKKKK